ncbi:MAG: carboxylesterase/lipase family protein [Steroidobacteraceae bacterium]
MSRIITRRTFVRGASLLAAAAQVGPWVSLASAAEAESVIADTAAGKLRGFRNGEIRTFKGIPYGESTAGKNRFMAPVKKAPWTGTRDALAFGPSSPQPDTPAGSPGNAEDCLVLNVFTPGVGDGKKRPVMVWLHGGGFRNGSGSTPVLDGSSLAQSQDVVVVTLNHRLNVFGFTYLAQAIGADFAESGTVGMMDLVVALEWVRDNIGQFGGDPGLVTIFGQSGGGRKVATLMAMPSAKGLFHRAIIESGAVLRLTTPEDGQRQTEMLLNELGLKPTQARELQSVPMERLVAASDAVNNKFVMREPGMTENSPTVGNKVIPSHPWDPAAPALSASIPLLIGYAHTEETWYDRPTPEKLALDEAGLKKRVAERLGASPDRMIDAFRKGHPEATPWDLWILIASEHPRGAYARETAKRKAAQGGAPAYFYRFDWETPELGGHMRSPHTIEIQFVFNNIKIAGPLISKRPDAYALAEKVSASWAAFARTGNPNIPQLPKWPVYSAAMRDTMLFDNDIRVAQDPDRGPRLAMDQHLKLS